MPAKWFRCSYEEGFEFTRSSGKQFWKFEYIPFVNSRNIQNHKTRPISSYRSEYTQDGYREKARKWQLKGAVVAVVVLVAEASTLVLVPQYLREQCAICSICCYHFWSFALYLPPHRQLLKVMNWCSKEPNTQNGQRILHILAKQATMPVAWNLCTR